MINELNIKELTWGQAKGLIKNVNPELAKIIDKISPGQQFKLLRATYRFGDPLLKNTKLHFPLKKPGAIAIDHPSIPHYLKESYGYNHGANPVSILLNKSAELFITQDQRIIPFALAKPGSITGAWRILDEDVSHAPATYLWSMTAGARSLFMLPKISKQTAHQRLKKHFQINIDKPANLQDHWSIFKELSNSLRFPDDWQLDILYFNHEWFKFLNDPMWQPFHYYLLKSLWRTSGYWRNQFTWDSLFSNIRLRKQLVPSPQVTELTKHILMIGVGAIPGFEPAINDNCAPVKTLQKIYSDIYKLEKYAPCIMQPGYFSMHKKSQPIYYSLQVPTALEYSPKSSKHSTSLSDLYDIENLFKKYMVSLSAETSTLASTPMANLVEQVRYNFYHTNTGFYKNILPCRLIANEDSRFLQNWHHSINHSFAQNSHFFNGCVSISM